MNDNNDRDAVDLLHLMGHLYLKSGQTQRALVLLLIATRMAPDHTGVLHALCRGFLASGDAQRALNVIARLEAGQEQDHTLLLLKSRAEWMNGDRVVSRQHFQAYIEKQRLEKTRLEMQRIENRHLDERRIERSQLQPSEAADHPQGAPLA